nr:hypothetical protein [Tanacetum cinerariifolium]
AAPEVGLEEEVAAIGPLLSKKRRKRVNGGADANAPCKSTRGGKSLLTMGLAADSTFVTPTDTKGVSDPDSLEEEIKRHDQEIQSLGLVESEVHGLKSQEKNLNTRLEAEVDMKKAAEAKNAELSKELESLHPSHRRRKVKATFKEFKKYEDDRVEKRCAEIDARLDALSIEFGEELYPHMLTAIAGMSKGIEYGVKQGEAKLDLAAIEEYDLEADDKYIIALHALKDLKYPLVDQL